MRTAGSLGGSDRHLEAFLAPAGPGPPGRPAVSDGALEDPDPDLLHKRNSEAQNQNLITERLGGIAHDTRNLEN